jgi:hypothetical protein
MQLLQRLKQMFNPHSHSATLSHYIPAPDFSYEPIENSIWRSELEKRPVDWRGDTGRVYDQQVLATQGPLLFPLKTVISAGLGGAGNTFGQGGTFPVAGFAGRPAVIDSTTYAAEYNEVNS